MDTRTRADIDLVSRITGLVSDTELAAASAAFFRAQRAEHDARHRPTFIGVHDRLEAEMMHAWAELVRVCQDIDTALVGDCQ